jgi:hypothetical protein
VPVVKVAPEKETTAGCDRVFLTLIRMKKTCRCKRQGVHQALVGAMKMIYEIGASGKWRVDSKSSESVDRISSSRATPVPLPYAGSRQSIHWPLRKSYRQWNLLRGRCSSSIGPPDSQQCQSLLGQFNCPRPEHNHPRSTAPVRSTASTPHRVALNYK